MKKKLEKYKFERDAICLLINILPRKYQKLLETNLKFKKSSTGFKTGKELLMETE